MASGTFFRDSLYSIIGKFWGGNLDLHFCIRLFKVKQEYISNHTTSRFNSMWFSNVLRTLLLIFNFLWFTCRLPLFNKINAYRVEKVNEVTRFQSQS